MQLAGPLIGGLLLVVLVILLVLAVNDRRDR
jgi:hypothetical protein